MSKVFTNPKVKEILDKYKTLWSLYYLSGLSHWDLETYMPEDGAKVRGEALAKVSSLSQEIFLDKKFTQLIKDANKEANLNDQEKSVLRLLNRSLDYYEKLPAEFLEEMSKVTSEANVIWRNAKENNSFKEFEEILGKIIDLTKRKADYLGYENHPYDALIDLYEEGWTTNDVESYFDSIREPLKEILDKHMKSDEYVGTHKLESEPYSKEKMEEFNQKVLELVQYDPKRMRLDISSHPFTIDLDPTDVRITTRYPDNNFASSYASVVHEFGHALYALQSSEDFSMTPISGGTSLVIHESQSRFWENIVGRSKVFLSQLEDKVVALSPEIKTYVEEQGLEGIHNYLNIVSPGFIRVEADELTYHFHIMLRFEIEKKMVEGSVKVSELPDLWNQYMKEYLGVTPPNDTKGVLQDVHWCHGSIGYFPTYSIGTFLSGMWQTAIQEELGNFDDLISNAEGIKKIKNWLKENVHQYGSTYTMKDLLKKVLDREFDVEDNLEYLRGKFK